MNEKATGQAVEWLTPKEAAARLGCDVRRVYWLVRVGLLRACPQVEHHWVRRRRVPRHPRLSIRADSCRSLPKHYLAGHYAQNGL